MSFRAYIEKVTDLTHIQKGICLTLFEQCSTIISQTARKSQLTLASISLVLYKLMSLAHQYKNLDGADKKEIVVHTLIGGLISNQITVHQDTQRMIEDAVDVIWFTSHEIVFPKLKSSCLLCISKCKE